MDTVLFLAGQSNVHSCLSLCLPLFSPAVKWSVREREVFFKYLHNVVVGVIVLLLVVCFAVMISTSTRA